MLKANTCDVKVNENQSTDVKTEHICIDLTQHNLPTKVAENAYQVASSSTQQNSISSASNAAIALMSLYNNTAWKDSHEI